MGNYKFPLQKLLEMRMDKEDESKREFVNAQNQKQLVENRLNTMKEDYKKYSRNQLDETILEKRIKHNYLNALTLGINEKVVELDEKNKLLEEKRQDLKQKQIDRKTVEILKEKRTLAFNKEEERKEQVTNDEFALYSFVRRLERR